jgi:hypothetical protein
VTKPDAIRVLKSIARHHERTGLLGHWDPPTWQAVYPMTAMVLNRCASAITGRRVVHAVPNFKQRKVRVIACCDHTQAMADAVEGGAA